MLVACKDVYNYGKWASNHPLSQQPSRWGTAGLISAGGAGQRGPNLLLWLGCYEIKRL